MTDTPTTHESILAELRVLRSHHIAAAEEAGLALEAHETQVDWLTKAILVVERSRELDHHATAGAHEEQETDDE